MLLLPIVQRTGEFMKALSSIVALSIISSFFVATNQAQAQWSVQENVTRRFPHCIIKSPNELEKCIGVSFTTGNYSKNLHFDLDNLPTRGMSFVYPKSISTEKFLFHAVADSNKNVMRIEGNCLISASSIECITEDGRIHAKAWQ